MSRFADPAGGTIAAACLVLGSVLAVCGPSARAQESERPPQSDRPPAKKSSLDDQLLEKFQAPGQSDAEPQPQTPARPASDAKPSKSKNDDDEESRTTGDKPAAEKSAAAPLSELADETPLGRAIRGMRSAQERIARRDTGQDTQNVQQQIVKDIEELIELAKRQPPRSPSPSPQNQQEQQQQEDDQSSESDSQVDGAGGEGARKQDDDGADQTTEQTGKRNQAEAELARRQQLINEIWGHLPPALRRELMNIGSERYLPKYDEWVRRYYESLAEPAEKPARPGF